MVLKKKVMATITAVSLVTLLVMGTFAWTNFSAQIVNVFTGLGSGGGGTNPIGPGGTLHNDYNDESRQVYIENWGSEPIFVRIRLDEYMEMGEGAGYQSEATNPDTGESIPHPSNSAVSVVSGASIDVLDSWAPHVPIESTPYECDSVFHDFWQWEMGGQKFFFPAPESDREDPSFIATGSPANLTADSVSPNGVNAQQTRSSEVLTMAQWMDDGSTIGDYWVIDTDGWAYWAAPLSPENATGLLLNSVTLINPPEHDYFYGINVVAQMATQDLHEVDNFVRFGDEANGGWTVNGQMLMELITSDEVSGGNQTPSVLGGVFRAGYISDLLSHHVPREPWIISDYNDFMDSFNRFRSSASNAPVNREYIVANFDNILNMYNENFFEDRSLAVVYVWLGSIAQNIEYNYSTISDNTVTIAYSLRQPTIIPGMPCGFFIIVEVDNNITNIVANRTIIPAEPFPSPPPMSP